MKIIILKSLGKIIFAISVLQFAVGVSLAQSYVPFPTENAHWLGIQYIHETFYSEYEMIDAFPNPAQITVFINVPGNLSTIYTLTIYNALGKVVLVKPDFTSNEAISIINFQNGVYYYRLQNQSGLIYYSGRFLKM